MRRPWPIGRLLHEKKIRKKILITKLLYAADSLCTYTQNLHTKIFGSYGKKIPLRYAYIYTSGDINKRVDVSVHGLEVGIEIHTFLTSARHANKWTASNLSRFAPVSHRKEYA